MKYFPLFLALIFSSLTFTSLADEGDTIVIQTIDWDTPVLPGWNSPRSGIYQFPGDTISFSKILMYYTLKCDPSQNPACGEWDYTTHTHIREHTGILDSNLYYHPNYMVNNASPDSFMFMNSESYYYKAMLHYDNQTEPNSMATIGSGGYSINFEGGDELSDGRAQFIYQANELIDGGLNSGEITGLQLFFNTNGLRFKHFQIRIKHTNIDLLPADSLVDFGFETVFNQHWDVTEGVNQFKFSFPFDWDGASNLLIDYSWADHKGESAIEADQLSGGIANYSGDPDFFLDFEGWDYVNVPEDVFSTIDSAITISFWQYGNQAIQPINSSIFEAVNGDGNRVLNIHLPWSNGRIYWDAGSDDEGYDRIDRGTSDPSLYEGKWNFWTFTKDVRDGMMRIFLNGQLWFQGSVKNRPINGIESCRIGAGITYDGFYAGMIDDVRIWDTVLEWDVIKAWMHKDVDENHPNYNHLRAYYQFNDGNGFTTTDSSPNGFDGSQFGYPEWMNYRGENRFKNAQLDNLRPFTIIENGDYDVTLLDSIVVVDSFNHAPVIVVLFDPDNPPVPADTLTKWPGYYHNYIYDEGGIAIDSTLVAPDGIFYHEDWPYYGEPYELIVPWEIARFITPYGNGLSLGEGFTWVYDVTDYEPFLRDSVHITAGNFQELLDMKFYMIEGTPPRDVKKIEKVYSGYWNLDNFPTLVPPDTIALIEEASGFKVKTRTSGHLFDNPTNCAEFCPKMHSMLVNGEKVHEWQILQECSDNPLYPQGGTWIYDRAGWCPGAKVAEQDIEITPYISNDTVILDYNSEPDPYGQYVLEVQLFSYGEPNFNLDLTVDEIIAPNKLDRYGRFNPTGSNPIVVIQNLGSDTVTNFTIEYGPEGSNKTYEWSGNLGFMGKTSVKLDAFEWEEWLEGNGVFNVSVSNPNNNADENMINNNFTSAYDLPTVFPATFVIHFKTNLTANQNSYEILSKDGIQIFEKSNFEPSTLYIDTITLFNDCYDFYMWDSGDNGISFWANSEGHGYLRFYNLEGERFMNFNGDFGDRIYHSFYTDLYLGEHDQSEGKLAFEILPNPSNGRFTVSYATKEEGPISINIFNTSGKRVWFTEDYGQYQGKIRIDLKTIQPGIYTCVLESDSTRLTKKFVVQ